MKLEWEILKDAVCGAAYLEKREASLVFHRFTKEQEERYRALDAGDALRTFATAGIQIRFRTNSRTLRMEIAVSPGSSRSFFAVDVLADGRFVGAVDNLDDPAHSLGIYRADFTLNEGGKEIQIVFPWSVKTELRTLILEDGSTFVPAVPQKRLLSYGDSITQGYDVRHPKSRYTAVLAQMLGCEERCKAIGGAHFTPWLADTDEKFSPDYITVAYGTNDWRTVTKEKLAETAMDFLAALQQHYPGIPVFLIAPIIRMDAREERPFGAFETVAAVLKEAAATFEQAQVIDGIGFVPKDAQYFADGLVHPNEEGMRFYSEALCGEIRKRIEE